MIFFKSCTLLKFFKILGLIPYNLNDSRLTLSYTYVFGMITTAIVYTLANILNVAFSTDELIRGFNSLSVSVLFTIVMNNTSTVGILLAMAHQSPYLPKIIKLVESVNEKIHLLKGNVAVHSIRRTNLTVTCGIFIWIGPILITQLLYCLYIFMDWSNFNYCVLFTMSKFLITGAMCFAFSVLNMLHNLWTSVENLIISRMDQVHRQFGPEKLNMINVIHQNLLTASNLVGDYFGPAFLVAFLSLFVWVTINMYYTYGVVIVQFGNYGDGIAKYWDWKVLTLNLGIIVYYILLLLSVTSMCQAVIKKSKNVQLLLMEMNLNLQETRDVKVVLN